MCLKRVFFFDASLSDVCSLSGLWSMSVVVETCCLSPDARLPVGSKQAEQPGKCGQATEQKSIWSLQSFCEFRQQRHMLHLPTLATMWSTKVLLTKQPWSRSDGN